MHCPVCGTLLGDSQSKCSGCGYSFSEPLDLHADVAPPGVRPHEVILATKLLVLNVGLNLVIGSVFRFSFAVIALEALFIALIWWGVGWARILFLFKVVCLAAFTVWGLMASATMNQVSGYLASLYGCLTVGSAIDLFVAYLLLQRESRNWFYDRTS
jgi:hypothetical protein